MDAYIIIGAANMRKSSTVRCLTGATQESVREVLLQPTPGAAVGSIGKVIQVHVEVSSLQEKGITEQAYVALINSKRCNSTLFCLWPTPLDTFNDALSYVKYFQGIGWNVVATVVLGTEGSTSAYPNKIALASGIGIPNNLVAHKVRNHFGWV